MVVTFSSLPGDLLAKIVSLLAPPDPPRNLDDLYDWLDGRAVSASYRNLVALSLCCKSIRDYAQQALVRHILVGPGRPRGSTDPKRIRYTYACSSLSDVKYKLESTMSIAFFKIPLTLPQAKYLPNLRLLHLSRHAWQGFDPSALASFVPALPSLNTLLLDDWHQDDVQAILCKTRRLDSLILRGEWNSPAFFGHVPGTAPLYVRRLVIDGYTFHARVSDGLRNRDPKTILPRIVTGSIQSLTVRRDPDDDYGQQYSLPTWLSNDWTSLKELRLIYMAAPVDHADTPSRSADSPITRLQLEELQLPEPYYPPVTEDFLAAQLLRSVDLLAPSARLVLPFEPDLLTAFSDMAAKSDGAAKIGEVVLVWEDQLEPALPAHELPKGGSVYLACRVCSFFVGRDEEEDNHLLKALTDLRDILRSRGISFKCGARTYRRGGLGM